MKRFLIKQQLIPLIAHSIFLSLTLTFTLHTYDIPRWYRAYHWNDEPRFIQKGLTTLQGTFFGGTHHTDHPLYKRISVADFWFDWYQNFQEGTFVHIQLPWAWQRLHLHDGNDQSNAGLCYPSATVGIASSFQEHPQLDFIDTTLQCGLIIGNPHARMQGPVPQAESTSPALFIHLAHAIGCFEWATAGWHISATGYNTFGLFSGSCYVQADHIIPTLSFSAALVADGQVGHAPTIEPWYMMSFSVNLQVDTATDTYPNRPYFHLFCNVPFAHQKSIAIPVSGGVLGAHLSWTW